MNDNIYRQMQKKLDSFSMGFPATASGIEIKILKYLFSETDAAMFMDLSHKLETPETIAERTGRDLTQTQALLEDMALRGLIFRTRREGTSRYMAIAFVHGIFEFQVKTIEPELSRMTGQYFSEAFDSNIQENADYFLRVIPVNQSIEVTHNVASYNDAVEILKSKRLIVVTDCVCRKRTEVINEGCGKMLENCFMFGSMARYYLDNDLGREIQLEEAKKILKRSHEEGMVTQPATSQNPGGMCNCCGDCCGILSALRKDPAPAKLVFSNHVIQADPEACVGCEVCLDRCQMDALDLDNENRVRADAQRCIGCGLCVTTCPSGALTLVEKPEKERRLPPVTTGEQMQAMAEKRSLG